MRCCCECCYGMLCRTSTSQKTPPSWMRSMFWTSWTHHRWMMIWWTTLSAVPLRLCLEQMGWQYCKLLQQGSRGFDCTTFLELSKPSADQVDEMMHGTHLGYVMSACAWLRYCVLLPSLGITFRVKVGAVTDFPVLMKLHHLLDLEKQWLVQRACKFYWLSVFLRLQLNMLP